MFETILSPSCLLLHSTLSPALGGAARLIALSSVLPPRRQWRLGPLNLISSISAALSALFLRSDRPPLLSVGSPEPCLRQGRREPTIAGAEGHRGSGKEHQLFWIFFRLSRCCFLSPLSIVSLSFAASVTLFLCLSFFHSFFLSVFFSFFLSLCFRLFPTRLAMLAPGQSFCAQARYQPSLPSGPV